jgi:glycerate 2-kinase
MRLLDIALAAIAVCRPQARCAQAAGSLRLPSWGRVHLLGAGKAAPAMARGVLSALSDMLEPRNMPRGLVITKDQHQGGFSPDGVELRFAGHPEPDERSVSAGRSMRGRLAEVSAVDHVVALVSGGASALLAEPIAGLGLGDLRAATACLVGSGVAIADINTVRRHLTRASGGRLAQACAGRVDVLLLSDVLDVAGPDDDLAAVGSGPFAPDPTSYQDSLWVAETITGFPEAPLERLRAGARGEIDDTPIPGDGCFDRVTHHVVASHATLLEAAVEAARGGDLGVRRMPAFGGSVEEAAARIVAQLDTLEPGEVLVTGGEPTVALPPEPGKGGRNQQLALHVAKALDGGRPCRFVAVGSDGGDGPTDAAGAWVDHATWSALTDPEQALVRADAYPLLDASGHLIRTGPTGTNVLDLHLLEVLSEP